MKYALFMALAVLARALVVCPDGIESNCYPQVFEPSNKWQVVREGQHIPAGLHVRLNLETGEQEARLLQPETGEKNAELALLDQDEDDSKDAHYDTEAMLRARKKSRFSKSDLLDYDSAVLEVLDFTGTQDVKRLETALETLVELSHDIDFGVLLTSQPRLFGHLADVAEMHQVEENEKIADMVYRVMGASLRNNPEATEVFIKKHQASLVPRLFDTLRKENVSETVKKRILGVIQPLASNVSYAFQHMNLNHGENADVLNSLISVFPHLGESSKERVLHILEDLSLVEDHSGSASGDADQVFSGFLQQVLQKNQVTSEPQLQNVFRSLAKLHEKSRIPVDTDFLHWLSKEAEERRTGLKQRDGAYSKEDQEFDSYMASARHGIFGNPYAARKQNDEL